MKDMKRREISSEDLLKKAATMVSKDLEKDLQEYENRAEALPDEEAPLDENFLKFAREYDGEHRKKNGLADRRSDLLCSRVHGISKPRRIPR